VAQRLSTTDGVASGTARTIGGLAYVQTAVSAAVTNTTTETDFDKSYTIPADTLKAGSLLRIKGWGTTTASNSTDTLQIKLIFGSATILTTAAVDQADDDIWSFSAEVVVRTVGASGTFVGHVVYQDPDAAGTARKEIEINSTALDTTGTLVVKASATWSVADSGNSCRSEQLTVEIT